MKDSLYIKSRLNDICCTIIPQDKEALQIHQAKQNTLLWIYNKGNIRTVKELEYRIRRLQEELQVLTFSNTQGFPVKLIKSQLLEVQNILKD